MAETHPSQSRRKRCLTVRNINLILIIICAVFIAVGIILLNQSLGSDLGQCELVQRSCHGDIEFSIALGFFALAFITIILDGAFNLIVYTRRKGQV